MKDDKEILVEKVRELERGKRIDPNNTADVLGEKRYLSEPLSDDEARRQMSRTSRRGFLVGGAAALIGVFGWRWMPDDMKAGLLRRTFEFNERVSQMFYRPSRLAPEFSSRQVSERRVNGMLGLGNAVDQAAWSLTVAGLYGRDDTLTLSLDDIKKLPRVEMTTELKCIEGWSVIVQWAGARFSDFASQYLPKTIDDSRPSIAEHPEKLVPYVSLSTPDNGYFVGWDMPSILHPQTLLAYEMNGEPLLPEHGAPLRLASPTKYGIKLIKRIGRIEFTAERPRDYWAESGYDWYSGH